MMTKNPYPILEFDNNKNAKLNPSVFVSRPFDTDKMVITFFPEVVDTLIAEEKIKLDRMLGGENPVYVYRFTDTDILITLGAIGCPACGGNLDLFHAMGITKVMFCGGGGVLDKSIEVGQLLVVDGAIRAVTARKEIDGLRTEIAEYRTAIKDYERKAEDLKKEIEIAKKEADADRKSAVAEAKERAQKKIDTYIEKIEEKDQEISRLKYELAISKLTRSSSSEPSEKFEPMADDESEDFLY